MSSECSTRIGDTLQIAGFRPSMPLQGIRLDDGVAMGNWESVGEAVPKRDTDECGKCVSGIAEGLIE